MANSQCFSCNASTPIQGKQCTWGELVEGEEVYDVETILSHRKQGWGYQYFVKWWGYPISDASWEPEHVFSDDGDILTQYKLRHSF